MHASRCQQNLPFGAAHAPPMNARAWVCVDVSRDIEIDLGAISFITGFDGIACYGGRLVDAASLEQVPAACYQQFEPVRQAGQRALRLREAHNQVRVHTWGDPDYTLPLGARRATLVDEDRLLQLRAGDVLVFEQVRAEVNGAPADAHQRHAVRLTRVEAIGEVAGDAGHLLAIEWHADDALPFALPVARRAGRHGAAPIDAMTVVRANVLLVDHGATVREAYCIDGANGARPGRHVTHTLAQGRLTFAEAFGPHLPASAAFRRSAQLARPQVCVTSIAADGDTQSPPVTAWQPRAQLDDSGPHDCHVAVGMRGDGRAELRFGDGVRARRPNPGAIVIATYRIGQGTAGNVGRDKIAYMVVRGARLHDVVVRPRNPLSAAGGSDAGNSAASAARNALAGTGCAVHADDYAALAARHPDVRQAAAWCQPEEGGQAIQVVVDAHRADRASWTLRQEVDAMLAPYRAARDLLSIVVARRVPLELGLRVRLLAGADPLEVRRALCELFGAGVTRSGQLGLFHPERIRPGQPVHAMTLWALAASVRGVAGVQVGRFGRRGDASHGMGQGLVAMERAELAWLDLDPDHPVRTGLEIEFVG